MKKKLFAIIPIILFLAFGLSLRKSVKDQQELEVKSAISEYEEAIANMSELESKLDTNNNLDDEDLKKLEQLEEEYESLLTQFKEYKSQYPENINEEIDNQREKNEVYSTQVSKLEGNIGQLSETVVKSKQVVSNSSSHGGTSSTLNSGSSSSSNSTGSANNSSSESSGSIGTVYANGGTSTSNKYHSSPTAHNMEGAIPMSESEATSKGYVACKRCY